MFLILCYGARFLRMMGFSIIRDLYTLSGLEQSQITLFIFKAFPKLNSNACKTVAPQFRGLSSDIDARRLVLPGTHIHLILKACPGERES